MWTFVPFHWVVFHNIAVSQFVETFTLEDTWVISDLNPSTHPSIHPSTAFSVKQPIVTFLNSTPHGPPSPLKSTSWSGCRVYVCPQIFCTTNIVFFHPISSFHKLTTASFYYNSIPLFMIIFHTVTNFTIIMSIALQTRGACDAEKKEQSSNVMLTLGGGGGVRLLKREGPSSCRQDCVSR